MASALKSTLPTSFSSSSTLKFSLICTLFVLLLNVVDCENFYKDQDVEISKMFIVKSSHLNVTIHSLFKRSCDDVIFIDDFHAKIIGRSSELAKIKSLGLEIVEEITAHALYDNPPEGYHSPEELLNEFKMLQTKYSSRALIVDLTATYASPTTIEGRRIYALKISDNVSIDESEHNILLVSGHHCRELITPEIALNTSRYILEKYDTDFGIRDLVNSNQIYIIWDQNPDGSAYVWSRDNMWRKNRRQNPDATFGVDLNRNYPVGWDFACGGSTDPGSEDYRGLYAGSESETQTMLAFHEDRRFSRVLDFHSYSEEVRTIYADCASLPQTIDDYFVLTAQSIAKQSGYQNVRSCCMGGNIHSAYNTLGALSYLVETGQDFQPVKEEMESVLTTVLPATLYFLTLPIPLSGTIKDTLTGLPLEAHISIEGVDFLLSESKRSNPRNGLYHLWLPNGLWNVTITAQGHSSHTALVEIIARGVVRDFLI